MGEPVPPGRAGGTEEPADGAPTGEQTDGRMPGDGPDGEGPARVGEADLTVLMEDVGVVATVGMIDLFVASLPGRLARLHAAVRVRDRGEVRAAGLSIACSATMLGEHRLAAAARAYARTATPPGDAGPELERLGADCGRRLRLMRARLGN